MTEPRAAPDRERGLRKCQGLLAATELLTKWQGLQNGDGGLSDDGAIEKAARSARVF
jgi:hypothetical protein